jgi:hypothetical protein
MKKIQPRDALLWNRSRCVRRQKANPDMAGASGTRLGLSNAQSAVPRPPPTGRSACVGAGDAESLPKVCEWRPRTLCFGFLADTTMLRWARERNKRSVQAIRVRARCRIKLVQNPCYEHSSTAEVPTGRKETKMKTKDKRRLTLGAAVGPARFQRRLGVGRPAGPPARLALVIPGAAHLAGPKPPKKCSTICLLTCTSCPIILHKRGKAAEVITRPDLRPAAVARSVRSETSSSSSSFAPRPATRSTRSNGRGYTSQLASKTASSRDAVSPARPLPRARHGPAGGVRQRRVRHSNARRARL